MRRGANASESMTAITIAAVFLISVPTLWAHREGLGLQASSSSRLEASSAAETTVAQAAFFEGLHRKLVECQGAHSNDSQHKETADTQTSVKKIGDCVNAIASFAEATKQQREVSIKANRNYAEDLKLAKKILRYLTKQTDTHEAEFKEFRDNQQKHLATVEGMLMQVEQDDSHNATPISLMDSSAGNAATRNKQAEDTPPWERQAALLTHHGQNFKLPGSASAVQRPSLMQVGPQSLGDSGAALQASLDGGLQLQEKLDREAGMLEAEELGEASTPPA